MICLGSRGFHLIEVLNKSLPKSRGYFEFYPDFNSSTKAICLSKKELRIKAKVRHLHEKDFYFKIFGSSFYLLSLESFPSRLSFGGNQKILISDFSGFRTSSDNGGYSQQSPKTLGKGKTNNLFFPWRVWCAAKICWHFVVLLQHQIKYWPQVLIPCGRLEPQVVLRRLFEERGCEVYNNKEEQEEEEEGRGCLRSQCVDWKHCSC